MSEFNNYILKIRSFPIPKTVFFFLEFLNFPLVGSISRIYSRPARSFSSHPSLIFITANARLTRARRVNLHSVHSFSIHRGVQTVSRAIRKRRHPHLPMPAVLLCAFIARVSEGAGSSRPSLFDISLVLLNHSMRKNTQGFKKEKAREGERAR